MSGQRLTNVIKLFRGDGDSPTEGFTESVGNVVDFDGPSFTNDRIEVTDGDSPGNSKEYLGARQDPGTLSTTLNLVPSVHAQIVTDASASPPTVRNYRLQFSATAGDYFEGGAFVASFAPSGNSRGAALQAAVGWQPTALWALTAA